MKKAFLTVIAILILISCNSSKPDSEYEFVGWNHITEEEYDAQVLRYNEIYNKVFNLSYSFSEQEVLHNMFTFLDKLSYFNSDGKKYKLSKDTRKCIKETTIQLQGVELERFLESVNALCVNFGTHYEKMLKMGYSDTEKFLGYMYRSTFEPHLITAEDRNIWRTFTSY